MNKRLRTALQFIIFLSIGFGILYVIFTRQNASFQEDCALKGIPPEACSLWDKLYADFLSVDFFWLGLVLVAFMLSNVSRALRWLMLIRALGFRARFGNAFWTIVLGYFANLGLPRIGEVVRGAVFARYENIPVERALGTIVVGRAIDVVCLLVCLGLTFALEFDVIYGYFTEHFESSRLVRLIIYAVAFGILAVLALWIFRRRVKRFALYQRLSKVITGFLDGIRSVRSVHNIPLFLFHTLSIWVLYYLMMYLCFQAFGPTEQLSGAAALLTFVFGSLGIVFPSPGGMGTYHAMIMAALALYGLASEDAFSFANILYFSVQLVCIILFGLLALAVLPLINRSSRA
ncbi:MAG: lysylphosphatidylglycerol synthase transmembrane domain-containing protein [Saprospiraceae bacterium]|nr:lysylphosphatidylglycerol synthase transmembrane domain-containing protein [Saprospiraceae bacterium]